MERERLLIARFIREHPQFRYTIKYDEYCNMYILNYKTEEAVRSMGIPSGFLMRYYWKNLTMESLEKYATSALNATHSITVYVTCVLSECAQIAMHYW